MKNNKKQNNIKQIAMLAGFYTSGSILGPLILCGTIGYFLDKVFETKPLIILISIFIAFIITNILLYKKVNWILKKKL